MSRRKTTALAHPTPPPSAKIIWILIPLWFCWILSWDHGYLFSWYLEGFKANALKSSMENIFTLIGLIGRMPILAVKENIVHLTWAIGVFGGAFVLGNHVLHASKLEGLCEGHYTLAIGIGLGAYSHFLLFLGLAGLWFPFTMKALVFIPILIGILWHWQDFWSRFRWDNLPEIRKFFSIWNLIGLGLLASYLTLNLSAALGPEFFYDSLVYHLALPKLFLLNHQIVSTPAMLYSGIPFGTEMLYGLGLGIADERLAKLIQCGFGVMIAATIFGWCRKRMHQHAAVFAVALFYCAPVVFFESSVAKVELSWTFYTLIAVLTLLAAQERTSSHEKYKMLAISGILAGFAASTKYNAALYLFMLPAPLLYLGMQEGKPMRLILTELGIFLGSAILIASPWYLKNFFFYGNPIYPFLNDLWNRDVSINAAGLASDARARNLAHLLATIDGAKNFFSGTWNPADSFDNYLGISAQILFPWMFLSKAESKQRRSLLLVLLGIWLAWALHTGMPRFLLPALPLAAILSAEATSFPDVPAILRYSTIGVVYYTLVLNLSGSIAIWHSQGLWRVAFHMSDRDTYLLHEQPHYPKPYYSGVKFINETTPPDAQVLFLGEERGFYCERKFVTASIFDRNPIISLAGSSKDGLELAEKLRAKGITHLLANRASPRYYELLEAMDPNGRQTYGAMLSKHARITFDERRGTHSWVQVYRL